MPNPKDPYKLARYRRLMRWIALAKGYGKWMRGKSPTVETVEKRRATLIAVTNTPEARKRASERALANGTGSWMQGRDTRHYNRQSRAGLTYAEIYGENAEEEARKRRDSNRARWVGVRKADVHPRHGSDYRYMEWRNAVFERDGYCCQVCGAVGRLHAHHVKPWALFEELRYVVSNGLTLCPSHHRQVHSTRKRTRFDHA